MSPVAEEPLTLAALAKFHREIILPDIQRVVDASANGLRAEVNARFDDVFGHFDSIYQRFDRLETEYHMLVLGLKRCEERLDRVD
jgi:hypothetical protein